MSTQYLNPTMLFPSFQIYTHWFQQIPPILRSRELSLKAVQDCGWNLSLVPEHIRCERICVEAIMRNVDGTTWRYVPQHLQGKIALAFVKNRRLPLVYIPMHLRSEEICLEAVKFDGIDLKYVPSHMQTEAMCIEAVKRTPNSFRYVNDEIISEDFCLKCVQIRGWLLKYVPEHLKTREICITAMKDVFDSSRTLRYVPEHLRELILALKNNDWKELHVDVEEENPDFTCCVCLTNTKCVLFEKCNHTPVCFSCSTKIGKKCPLCRAVSVNTHLVKPVSVSTHLVKPKHG